MGGSDDASNLISVSVEEHAELHLALYLEHGKWEDYIAAQGLAGIIGHEDVVYHVSEQRRKAQSIGVTKDWENRDQKRKELSERNRRTKSQEIKKAWADGKYDNRTGLTGRPKGVKEKKPRKVRNGTRPVCYNNEVYPSCAHLARQLGTYPCKVRRWAETQTNGTSYV
jgi:hypothetical protein